VNNASADLKDGMLYIYLPKIEDRRGAEVIVAVKEASTE
jgi:HSP20 family molecular chaperone IbpA